MNLSLKTFDVTAAIPNVVVVGKNYAAYISVCVGVPFQKVVLLGMDTVTLGGLLRQRNCRIVTLVRQIIILFENSILLIYITLQWMDFTFSLFSRIPLVFFSIPSRQSPTSSSPRPLLQSKLWCIHNISSGTSFIVSKQVNVVAFYCVARWHIQKVNWNK